MTLNDQNIGSIYLIESKNNLLYPHSSLHRLRSVSVTAKGIIFLIQHRT